jgi:hypothetical protein
LRSRKLRSSRRKRLRARKEVQSVNEAESLTAKREYGSREIHGKTGSEQVKGM